MPATAIPVTTIDRTGTAPPSEVAMDLTNGNVLNGNNGVGQWIEVTNTGGSTATLTIAQLGVQDGVASPGKVFSLATTVKRRIGPFPIGIYGASVSLTPQSGSTITIMGYQLAAG